MEKWNIEFELLCGIMMTETEKRKELRRELINKYDRLEELDKKVMTTQDVAEKIATIQEVQVLSDDIEELEKEYDMIDYMIKRLKQERMKVLEED